LIIQKSIRRIDKAEAMPRVWLRHEVKADEHRAALTPSVCADLIQQGNYYNYSIFLFFFVSYSIFHISY